MAATAKTKGLKRICLSCSTRFYDLNKRPINCPNCKAEFTVDTKAKARRSRSAANDDPVVVKKPKDDVEVVERDSELVSLDEVAVIDDGGDIDEDGESLDATIEPLEDMEEDIDPALETDDKG